MTDGDGDVWTHPVEEKEGGMRLGLQVADVQKPLAAAKRTVRMGELSDILVPGLRTTTS